MIDDRITCEHTSGKTRGHRLVGQLPRKTGIKVPDGLVILFVSDLFIMLYGVSELDGFEVGTSLLIFSSFCRPDYHDGRRLVEE
jgi:hypothetical protein